MGQRGRVTTTVVSGVMHSKAQIPSTSQQSRVHPREARSIIRSGRAGSGRMIWLASISIVSLYSQRLCHLFEWARAIDFVLVHVRPKCGVWKMRTWGAATISSQYFDRDARTPEVPVDGCGRGRGREVCLPCSCSVFAFHEISCATRTYRQLRWSSKRWREPC